MVYYYKEKYYCLVSGATSQRVQTPSEDRGGGPSKLDLNLRCDGGGDDRSTHPPATRREWQHQRFLEAGWLVRSPSSWLLWKDRKTATTSFRFVSYTCTCTIHIKVLILQNLQGLILIEFVYVCIYFWWGQLGTVLLLHVLVLVKHNQIGF